MSEYVQPNRAQLLPKGLTLNQFLQSVLVGVSGIAGTLVRPDWQEAPPKQPDISTNWLAFGVILGNPDANAYIGVDADGNTFTQRHEQLELQCQFYGPNALDNALLVRDGFQIPQNLYALRAANMGFVSTDIIRQVPDLVNERWIGRYIMGVFLRREIQRVYPIPTILSATGQVHTVLGDEEYLFNWDTENRRS